MQFISLKESSELDHIRNI